MRENTLLDGDLRLAGRLDARFFALLDAIEATGSINRAARTAGYSYRGPGWCWTPPPTWPPSRSSRRPPAAAAVAAHS
jgi:hypothetical protein